MDCETEITNKSDNETEDAWLLRGLREYPADFVWVFLGDYVNWSTLLPTQTISWHPSSPFTSKVFFVQKLTAEDVNWYSVNA